MRRVGEGSRPLALVTGGCRRLGAAISAALGRAGYDLILHSGPFSRPAHNLTEELASTEAAWLHVTADLSQECDVNDLISTLKSGWGRPLSLLVNNAAQFEYDTLDTATIAGLQRHYMVNCTAPVLLAAAAASKASSDHRLAIINILDQRIASPNTDQISYTLSKVALAQATSILADRYAPYVRVSAVAPGLTIPTPAYTGALLAETIKQTPLRCLPQPRVIAEAVIYLARAESTTGQTLFVDGGAHLRRYDRDFLFLDSNSTNEREGARL